MNNKFKIKYLPNQASIFFDSSASYKIIHKGRRFGLTRGFAHYCIDFALDGNKKILWVDTVNQNIDRYYDRYFLPTLRQLGQSLYRFNIMRKELKILSSNIDLRSADKPESIEGFGYDLIIINEAGIVLKDESLWYNSILPMTLDYNAKLLVGGTPKGKKNRKLSKQHLFFELSEKAKVKSNWQDFHFSSYENPLLNHDDIEELISNIPYAVRRQEIFGDFIDDATSELIKSIWWQKFDNNPTYSLLKVDCWDTAYRKNEENDYTVKTSWILSHEGLFLYDYFKDRLNFPELKKQLIFEYDKNHPDEILIEDKASGISLIDEMMQTGLPIRPIKVDSDKIARANAASIIFENNRVFIKNESWSNYVINICSDFPSGEEDDTVDSITHAINYLKNKITQFNLIDIVSRPRYSILDNY